jgi:hypothetical protein
MMRVATDGNLGQVIVTGGGREVGSRERRVKLEKRNRRDELKPGPSLREAGS